MSRGTPALVGALTVATAATALIAALLVMLLHLGPNDGEPLPSFGEAVWQGLMHAFDPSALGGDSTWSYRWIMLGVGIVGLFIFSTLIGVLTTAVSERIEELRKGRSRVLESGHTLVLGWSPKTIAVLSELVIANDSRRDAVVVVLAPQDKVVMEDTIRERVDRRTTRFVCRSGSCLEPGDLEIANVTAARAVIVLPSEESDADTITIKTLLALRHTAAGLPGMPIVCALRDAEQLDAARLAAPDGCKIVLIDDVLSRITAQACRQRGLSTVLQELLDFDGDEIYFAPAGASTARTFGTQMRELARGVAIGVRFGDGRVALNPAADTPLDIDDRLIVIARDEDQIAFARHRVPAVDADAIVAGVEEGASAERTLVLGWNGRAPRILRQLDAYVGPGSTALVVARAAVQEGSRDDGEGLRCLSINRRVADATRRAVLDGLDVATCDHVIVLSSDAEADPQVADARTLVTLLHLRDIVDRAGVNVPIVSEMLDVRNRDLAAVTRADDFIVSDRLVSLLMVQIAENPELEMVFQDLFDPAGAEIYLKPAANYVRLGVPVTFHTVIESCLRRGQTALGYRFAGRSEDSSRAFGVVLNPDKDNLVSFADGDQVIVLAED
ncbi:MAG: potassium transporter TrkA [Anaerolineae bacterium]